MNRFRLSRHDALLLLMTVIWGINFSIVKVALRQIPPLAFNSLRLALASLLFLLALALSRRSRPARDAMAVGARPVRAPDCVPGSVEPPPLPVFERTSISSRDWLLITVFGLIGHFIYQLCFLLGIDRTTAANSSLILGCSPVVVALFSAALGHERVRVLHWIGAALSVVGIYAVVGHGAHLGGPTFAGDVLTIGGLFCWGAYTVGARGLLQRHSPLEVTGYSMAIGTVPFVLLGVGDLTALDWRSVHADAWAALAFSGVFALFVAYLIWYVAVQRIGNIRTAMYSNVTPIAALIFAVAWLGERLTPTVMAGAGAILAGMVLTRLVRTPAPERLAPAEE